MKSGLTIRAVAPKRETRPAEARPLSIAPPTALRPLPVEGLDQGLAAAAAALEAGGASPQQIRCGRVALCRLGAFPLLGYLPDAECRATVVMPVEGPFTATALFSFSPEDALRWVSWLEPGPSPRGPAVLEAYRAAATVVGGQVLRAVLGPSLRLERAALQEDSLVGTLLATHAPRETLLLCVELLLESGAEHLGGAFYLLADGKAAEAACLGLG